MSAVLPVLPPIATPGAARGALRGHLGAAWRRLRADRVGMVSLSSWSSSC